MRGLAALLALTAALAACGSATAAAQPLVRIPVRAPLTLAGERFTPGAKVRLHVQLGAVKVVRSVTTTSSGSFRSVFAQLRLDRCRRLRVVAVGTHGERASFTLQPLECPSAATTRPPAS